MRHTMAVWLATTCATLLSFFLAVPAVEEIVRSAGLWGILFLIVVGAAGAAAWIRLPDGSPWIRALRHTILFWLLLIGTERSLAAAEWGMGERWAAAYLLGGAAILLSEMTVGLRLARSRYAVAAFPDRLEVRRRSGTLVIPWNRLAWERVEGGLIAIRGPDGEAAIDRTLVGRARLISILEQRAPGKKS